MIMVQVLAHCLPATKLRHEWRDGTSWGMNRKLRVIDLCLDLKPVQYHRFEYARFTVPQLNFN
jgi:hypothetical protein